MAVCRPPGRGSASHPGFPAGPGPHTAPKTARARRFRRQYSRHAKTAPLRPGGTWFVVGWTPGSAIVLWVSPKGDVPHAASLAAPAAGQSLSASREKGVPGGAAEDHRTLSESLPAGFKPKDKAPHQASPAPSRICHPGSLAPVRGPRPAGHLGRRAPRLQLRIVWPETASQLLAPPSSGGSPSQEAPLPRTARVSSLSSSLLKPRRSPPACIPPPLPILQQIQPRRAPPAPSSFLRSSDQPPPPPLLFPPQTLVPTPCSPRPTTCSKPAPQPSPSPSFLNPGLPSPSPGFSPAQTPAPSPGPGRRRRCPLRSMLQGGLPRWAPAEGPSSAPALGWAAAGGLCGSGRRLGGGRRVLCRRPLR